MKTKNILWKQETQRYTPIAGGFQITGGTADYVRPIYAPHINDGLGNTRYIYYLGDRPKLVLSDADNGSMADNGSTGPHMVRYAHMFLGILNGGNSKWLEDMDHIVARYLYGREEYDIADTSFVGEIRLVYTRSDKLDAMLVKVSLPDELKDKLVVAAAGQRCAAGAQPVAGNSRKLEFQAADTEGTTVYIRQNKFMIADNKVAVSGTANIPLHYSVKDARTLSEGMKAFLASESESHPMVLGISRGNVETDIYLLLTTEATTNPYFMRFKDEAKELFEAGVAYYKSVSETIRVKTPNPVINAAVATQMMALDANWDEPIICHGPMGWHIGFAGWRGMYGFTVAGWAKRLKTNVRQFIKNQQSTGRITAYNANDSRYNMGEVLVDELMHYWLWSGDTEFFEKEAYSFVAGHLRFQEEYIRVPHTNLYENFLNAWNTDNKWNNGGPGSISTAYTWHAYTVMSQIAQAMGRTEESEAYRIKSDAILEEIKISLWDKDKGVYGEFRDVFGLKRLNTAPDLSSIYTPIDVGITDDIEGYQMLRYSDYAIDSIYMDGAEFKYSSNRIPEFYSSCGLYVQETLNNALAYFQTGQREIGYRQYMGCLIPLMKGRGAGPGASAHTINADLENTGHIDFADSASMHIRTAVEGLFGVRMQRAYGMAVIMPGFPEDWTEASIQIDGLHYSYRYAEHMDTFTIHANARLKYCMKIPARSSRVEFVKVNGQNVAFEVTKFVCFVTEALSQAVIEIKYTESPIAVVAGSAVGAVGSEYEVSSNGLIRRVFDPQGVIASHIELPAEKLTIVLSDKAGWHTFFVEVIKEDMTAVLPVDVEIKPAVELESVAIIQGKEAGITVRIKNNTQKTMAITADLQTVSGYARADLMLDAFGVSEMLFVPVKDSLDLTPGNNGVRAEIRGDYNGSIKTEVTDWALPTEQERFVTVSLEHTANQNLRTLHENHYDLTYLGEEHYRLPNFYFSRDSMRTVTATGRSWWEDLSRGMSGVPWSLELPEKGGIFLSDCGIPFEIAVTEEKSANAVFVSLYNQFPDSVRIPVGKTGTKIYFLLSVSTNNMQSRIENARITVRFCDGSEEVLPLVNPDNIDDWLSYQEKRTNDWDSHEKAKPYAESMQIFWPWISWKQEI